jgi:NADPH-dependent 2,4-dienoyl-CoA reductase/sulfur reductase-like enzyme
MSQPARRLDLVVVGGGPAGLAAAHAAAGLGRQVLLIDQAPRPGGQIWRHRPGDALPTAAHELLDAVRPPRVSVALGASVVDAAGPTRLIVDFGGRVAPVDTAAIVLATGATERLLPFPGWTLPGVVGVGGIQALLKSGLPVAGSRVVIAGAGPLAWPVASSLHRAGAVVEEILEQADWLPVAGFALSLLGRPATLLRALRYRLATLGVPYRTGSWAVRAEGSDHLTHVVLRRGGSERRVACDWLATAAGLVPRTQLGQLLGCTLRDEALVVDTHQATGIPGVWAAGECTGVSGDRGARLEGTIAGLAAAGVTRMPAALLRRRDRERRFGQRLERVFAPRRELTERVTPETIVCRCEDVRAAGIDPRWSSRQAKLWTRIGMGACQGAVCGVACRTLYGWDANAPRPPLEQPDLGGWARALADVTTQPGVPPPPDSPGR